MLGMKLAMLIVSQKVTQIKTPMLKPKLRK
jgi:hypothetical protein